MHPLLVPAQNELGKTCFVLKNYLGQLIKDKKIQRFRRSSGWLDVERDQREKDHDNGYNRRERRVSRMVDWSSFSLPMQQQLQMGQSLEAILGYGQKAGEIALKLESVAKTNLSVLIQGGTGTGKGVVALILHELSHRKDKPFIRVDCGAIPPTLVESELFGYEKGSFTGAFKSKLGRFQVANGGTIFLDEIANLSLEMQTRLLGFLEERVVDSIGAIRSVKLDVRIVSATNADLSEQIRRYQFREDLFYRLNEFEIDMPSLKERSDDLFYLATKFLTIANTELQKMVFGFSEKAIDFLYSYDWTGNIRELRNMIKRATLLADEVIEEEHLIKNARHVEPTVSLDCCLENAFLKTRPLPEINDLIREVVEKKIIERVYEQSRRNKKKTCEVLGINYSTLFRKMKEYSLA